MSKSYVSLLMGEVSDLDNPFAHHVVTDGFDDNHKVDGLAPKNREISRFMYLLDMRFFFGELKDGANEFYVLMPEQFEYLSHLYQSHHAILPRLISYRGNYFTADIFLKSYPFIEFEQLFIGKEK